MYVTQPLLPELSREFGVGPARAGLTVSAVVLAIALSSVLYGPLSDAAGRRRVMAGALAALALVTALCALPRSFEGLVAMRALQGLLVPGMTAVSVAYAGDRLSGAELSGAVGGIIAASVLGGLGGRVGAGLVAELATWRAAFLAFGGLTALAALAVWRGLGEGNGGGRSGLGAATRGLAGHLRNPPVAGACLLGFSAFFAWSGVFTYLPYLLSGPPHRLSTGRISAVYLVYAVGVVTSPLAGRLAGRVPARRVMGLGLAVAGGGLLLTLAGPLALVSAGLLVLVLGNFTAGAVAPSFVNASARGPKGSAGGLYLSSYYLGGTLGSVLPGLAWQRVGWGGVVAACAAALGLAGLANATLCGREPRGP